MTAVFPLQKTTNPSGKKMISTQDQPPDIEIRNDRLWLQWPDVYPYDIKLSRIRDQSDLGHWVHHLSQKNWMTPERLIEFITAAAKAKRWM